MTISRVRAWADFHRTALVTTIGIILIYSSHHFLSYWELSAAGKPYLPTIATLDERHFTFPKAKFLFETGHLGSDIVLEKYRGAPSLLPPLPHHAINVIFTLVDDPWLGMIVADFVFPPVAFFLFYLLGYQTTESRKAGLVYAFFIALIPRFFAYFPIPTSYYQAFYFSSLFLSPRRLALDGLENPLLTAPVLALALIALVYAYKHSSRRADLLAGAGYGLLFYTYFYFYVYVSLSLFILGVTSIIQKNRDAAWRVARITTMGLLLSIPYWFSFWALTHYPTYPDLKLRVGPQYSDHLNLEPIIIFVYAQHLLLCIAAAMSSIPERTKHLIWAFLLPVLAVYNIQIVTGYNPQPDHWIEPIQHLVTLVWIVLGTHIWRTHGNHPRLIHTIVSVILIATIVFAGKGFATENVHVRLVSSTLALVSAGMAIYFSAATVSRERIARQCFQMFIVLAFLKLGAAQVHILNENRVDATLPPDEWQMYMWLRENADPRWPVLSSSLLTQTYVQNLTHSRPYVPNGLNSIASNRELLDLFIENNIMTGVSETKTIEQFVGGRKNYDYQAISYLFGDMKRAQRTNDIFGDNRSRVTGPSGEEIGLIMSRYQSKLKYPYLSTDHYYTIQGPRERDLAKRPRRMRESVVFQSGEYEIISSQ